MADNGLHFLRSGGCFVQGTPVRLSAELASVSTNGRAEAITRTADATQQTTTAAIENVALGARVLDRNPRPSFKTAARDWSFLQRQFHEPIPAFIGSPEIFGVPILTVKETGAYVDYES